MNSGVCNRTPLLIRPVTGYLLIHSDKILNVKTKKGENYLTIVEDEMHVRTDNKNPNPVKYGQ